MNIKNKSFPDFSGVFVADFTIAFFKINLVIIYLLLKQESKLQKTMATLFIVSSENLKVV